MIRYEYKVILQPKFYSHLGGEFSVAEQEWLCSMGEQGWDMIYYQSLSGKSDLYKFKRVKL